MDYIELAIKLTPYSANDTEIITALLSQLGYESFMETENGVNAYIKVDDFDSERVLHLKNYKENVIVEISSEIIKDQNWNEIWEKNYFKPIQMGNKCVVRASFHAEFENAEYQIIIDPKTAFGTGNHATTFLILEEILTLNLEDKKILDMGCGTGILAILSSMKGASYILAVDNDPKAILNTNENIKVNNVKNITVSEGSTAILNGEEYDVIYENIWKNIVIADLPIIFKHLKTKGTLIVSGFYKEDVAEVRNAAEKLGLQYITDKNKDGWAIVRFEKI